MTDTAQLREATVAFAEFEQEYLRLNAGFEMVILPPVLLAHVRSLAAAAQELLTIREAGALIITPDEELAERIVDEISLAVYHKSLELVDKPIQEWTRGDSRKLTRKVLDALRDAMPDGNT